LNLSFSFLIVQNTIHLCIFSRRVGIFLEETADTGGTLVATAARLHVCFHLLLVVLDFSCFTNDDLRFASHNADTRVVAPDKGLHLVFYAALAFAIR
jgi:hypothetical protein